MLSFGHYNTLKENIEETKGVIRVLNKKADIAMATRNTTQKTYDPLVAPVVLLFLRSHERGKNNGFVIK